MSKHRNHTATQLFILIINLTFTQSTFYWSYLTETAKYSERCVCREEHYIIWRKLKERVWPIKWRKKRTRSKPHTHRSGHLGLFVNSRHTGRNVSFHEDVHTFMHIQGSSYLTACISLHISDSGVLSQRGTLSVYAYTSVLQLCWATDSISDDGDNDDDYDGMGWVKLASWRQDKGNFLPGISKYQNGTLFHDWGSERMVVCSLY